MRQIESASKLREWAIQCSAQADNPRVSGDERQRLLEMHNALLDLADADDWLRGHLKASPVKPVASSQRDA